MTKYHKDILKLAVSIVPKSSSVAVSMNIALRTRYPAETDLYDTTDKSTWIYYQNLRGERFKTLDTIDGNGAIVPGVYLQPKVYLNTLEDGTEIELTKDNLDTYTLTRVKLQDMGTLYRSLVNNYKDQELRIRSIIFNLRVDPLKAVDGTILLYNDSYLEYNEYTLMGKLETRIKNYLSRWDVKEFALGDKEYASVLLIRLIHFIFLNIINIKSQNINTLEVDSYHMRNYFNSNLRLGNIVSVLPNDIKFWMYKNLSTLIYNMGSNKTLTTIIDKVLTPSGVEVELFDIHPIEPSFKTIEEGIYNKDRIFTDNNKSNTSIENILFKEQHDNERVDIVYKDTGYRDSIFRRIANTKGTIEPTKAIMLKEKRVRLLSSIEIDLITLESCIMYLNNINDTFVFKDQETGINYTLASKNVIYTILLILRNMNNRVPSIKDKLYIHNLFDTFVLTTGFNTTLLGDETLQPTIDIINSKILDIPSNKDKASILSYIDSMVMVHTDIHYYMSNIESSKSKDVMRRLYHTASSIKTIELDNLEDFDRYILTNNLTIIDPNNRDASKWFILLNTILEEVVGKTLLSTETDKLDVFKDMLNKLTSYSIQTLKDGGGSSGSTLDTFLGYHYDIGAMRVIEVDVDCGSDRPIITSVKGNDGKLDNTLFSFGVPSMEILTPSNLNITQTSPLGSINTYMEIL